MNKTLYTLSTAVLMLFFAASAQAAHITVFNALIDADQANAGAGTGSAGTGAATMTFDSNTMLFEWFVGWQDLSGPATAAHFHGPAAPGSNAGVQVGIDHLTNPSIGSAVLTATQVADLLAGLWYLNIHTAANPGGEIRGQVLQVSNVPVPAALWLLASALAGSALVRRRKMTA